jgi:signal transduction histidine kinase
VLALLSTVQSLPDGDRADAERALIPFARDAALGALGPDIGHDVGNALFGVIGLIDLLEPGQALPRERLDLLRQSVGALDDALRQLLEFVRTTRDDRTVSDLAGLTRLAVGVYTHGGRTAAAHVPDVDVRVACPPGLTAQAILHLLLACGPRCTLELDGPELRVGPVGEPTIDEVVARRIALDHGGELLRTDAALLLRLAPA